MPLEQRPTTNIVVRRGGGVLQSVPYIVGVCSNPATGTLHCLQVKLLVQQGGADVELKDRWGASPLDEARRVNHTNIIAYMAP
jgi:hypothetical protein